MITKEQLQNYMENVDTFLEDLHDNIVDLPFGLAFPLMLLEVLIGILILPFSFIWALLKTAIDF